MSEQFLVPDLGHDPGTDVPRRTLLGAAWALPVVALAVATPSAAASQDATVFAAWDPDSVELPEFQEAQTLLTMTNTGHTTITTMTVLLSGIPEGAGLFTVGDGWDFSSGDAQSVTFIWTGTLPPESTTSMNVSLYNSGIPEGNYSLIALTDGPTTNPALLAITTTP